MMVAFAVQKYSFLKGFDVESGNLPMQSTLLMGSGIIRPLYTHYSVSWCTAHKGICHTIFSVLDSHLLLL